MGAARRAIAVRDSLHATLRAMASLSSTPISVSELNRRARLAVERALPLLWVTGEISNLMRAASGHLYFTLKDDDAQVRCVMFRSRAYLVPWQIANGQQVEAQGLASIYEARGDFQLNIESLRRAGLGKLYEAFARLRGALEAEGLFAPERKRTLPRFPRTIGIVTSLQAAALRDIIAACRRRAPHVRLILFATPVQGEGAGERIAQAIASADRAATPDTRCDVIIVARGGGSIEDLWAFNEEVVARAIANCSIPVASGVGHETDVTIADLVADQRGATPTAAAELATAGWFAAAHEIDALQAALQAYMLRKVETLMQRLDLLARSLVHPRDRLDRVALALQHLHLRLDAAMRRAMSRRAAAVSSNDVRLHRQRPGLASQRAALGPLSHRLAHAAENRLARDSHRLANLGDALKLLDPHATLARGYCIARDANDHPVTSSAGLRAGDMIELRFASGGADASVTRTR